MTASRITGNILVIDDDESILRLLAKFLKSEGHCVVTEINGSDAIETFKKEKFDLVITDMYMPDLDGLDIIRNIKDINQNIPIIVLTAAGSITNVVQSLKLGAFNYMTKPVNINEVREIIQKAFLTSAASRQHKNFYTFLSSAVSVFKIKSAVEHLEGISFYLNNMLVFYGFSSGWQIQLALTEAFTNAVCHGNHSSPDKTVTCEITFNKDEVTICIEDEGEGFEVPDLKNYKLNDDKYAGSGRGIFLINSYMDSVEFNEKGNRINMTKKRN